MFTVAITGNIATGKSSVCSAFSEFGISVINADEIARQISNESLVGQKIIDHFGSKILCSENTIDRRALRRIIFADVEEKKWLEALLHPLIRQQIERELATSNSAYCMVEIPLHFKRADYPYINQVIVVSADEDLQIQRLMARDHCTLSDAQAAIAAQPDLETRQSIADYVIINHGDPQHLKQEVYRLHQQFTDMAKA